MTSNTDWRRLGALFLLLALLAPVGANAALKKTWPPQGAVKLVAAQLKIVNGHLCGELKTTTRPMWVAGQKIRGGFFISHPRYASYWKKLSLKARGKTRKLYAKRAREQRLLSRRRCLAAPATSAPAPATSVSGGAWTPPPPPEPTPLRFDIDNSLGMAMKSPSARMARSAASGSNLQAVDRDGSTREAVVSGSAHVRGFMIAPGGKVYVVFESPVNLYNTSSWASGGCVLAEVNATNGEPTCIDASLASVSWNSGSRNKGIQFDSSGAIYYSGMVPGGTVLRKYKDGQRTDLINDNIQIGDFFVHHDGSVFISGQTTSTEASWLRRVSPAGGLQSIRPAGASILGAFPDGNVYFGMWNTDFGVRRYLTAASELDSKYWITGDMNGQSPERHFDTAPICAGQGQSTYYAFCGSFGSSVKTTITTPSGSVYAIAGHGADGLLMKYYPRLEVIPTKVSKISVAQGVISNMVLAGLDASDKHVLTLLDTGTGQERVLNGPDNEIEVYHVNYVANGNKVVFDGLRFADNRYVLGQVDLDTMQVSVAPTNTLKWADFQTFG